MLKLSKWLLNKCLPWQRQWQLNWYGSNQHTIIFLDKFFELSPKVDAVEQYSLQRYDSLKLVWALFTPLAHSMRLGTVVNECVIKGASGKTM